MIFGDFLGILICNPWVFSGKQSKEFLSFKILGDAFLSHIKESLLIHISLINIIQIVLFDSVFFFDKIYLKTLIIPCYRKR